MDRIRVGDSGRMCEVLQEALPVGGDEKLYGNTRVCSRGGSDRNEPVITEKSYK